MAIQPKDTSAWFTGAIPTEISAMVSVLRRHVPALSEAKAGAFFYQA